MALNFYYEISSLIISVQPHGCDEILSCKPAMMKPDSLGHLASLPCQLSKRPLASFQLGPFSGSDHLETSGAVPVWLEGCQMVKGINQSDFRLPV